jgi:UDP-glucose 4-epimerase
MTRVVVFGCAGFIASHLCDALVASGHDVVGVDNLSTGKRENINPGISFIEGDIRDFEAVKEVVKGADFVYEMAALARIQPSIDNPVEAHSVNATGALNVLEACRLNKVKRIIFPSSSSVYEGDELPADENAYKDAKNPYTLQKQIMESYISLYHYLYGLDYVVFRYFNIYGPRQILDGNYAAVVGIFLQQRKENKPLTINGDGSKRRDFTHVYDVTAANIAAMQLPTGVYNVGTGKNISIKELADAISPEQVYGDNAPGEVQDTLCDNSRLVAQGWRPTRHILDPEVLEEMDAAAR